MFTHTVDDAINRVTYKGTEIAASYDPCPFNPLEDMEIQGFAIRSHERGTTDYDPCDTLKDYEGWAEDKDNALYDIESTFDLLRERYGKAWWESVDEDTPYYAEWAQDIIDDIDAIDDYDSQLESYEVFEYTAWDEYGTPVYTVVVDMPWFKKTWGPSCSEHKDIALNIAKDYAAWANGSVYVIGVEREGEEPDYTCNVIDVDVFDDEALIEFAVNTYIL